VASQKQRLRRTGTLSEVYKIRRNATCNYTLQQQQLVTKSCQINDQRLSPNPTHIYICMRQNDIRTKCHGIKRHAIKKHAIGQIKTLSCVLYKSSRVRTIIPLIICSLQCASVGPLLVACRLKCGDMAIDFLPLCRTFV